MIASTLAFILAAAGPPSSRVAGPDSALNACVDAAAAQNKDVAKQSAQAAERHYRALMAADPGGDRAKVLLARVISQCLVNPAPVWRKEGLVKESNRLLAEVLTKDSTNWEARYTLALNYYHAPGFFGWTDNAIREFERLIAQQGESTLFPDLAKPFYYLGLLLDKKGRHADAVDVWRRGNKLFPNDPKLRERAGVAP